MIKRYLPHVLASSVLMVGGVAQVDAADVAANTNEVQIQRSFVNLDFSQPPQTVLNRQISQDLIPGWRTTHRYWGNLGRIIEIWRGAGYADAGTLPNASDDQYAELNAEEPSALYQKVCLFKGESFDWSFKHAARQNNVTETAEFLIGTVADQVAGNATYAVSSLQSITTSSVTRSQPGRWATRSGTVTVGNEIAQAGGIYSFIFRATNGSTLGNFLDDIKIGLRPAVEFSANSNKYYEGNDNVSGKMQSVPFNMVGQILSQSDMPTLKFKIEYLDNYSGAKAVYGVNYILYKQAANGNLTPLNADDDLNKTNPNSISFNYTPVYNSALDYTKGVQVNGLVIGILGNSTVNSDITVPFTFALDGNSKAIATSLRSCGNSQSDIKFDLKIQEDDIDLAVIKTLTPESVVQKDNLISYKLDVTNNTAVQADGVLLRDNFKNLLRVTTGDVANQTSLICEDLTSGNSKACPSTWTDANALTALLSSTTAGSGLSLGDIPANAKYRFTVKNLKVTDTDTSNVGFVENTAIIETTKMQDLIPGNNTSTVKTLIATKSDLSNNISNTSAADAAATGSGIFIIGKEGRTGSTPLWTQKADSNAKVYFPLNIQNYGNLAQDYQLYASSSKIEPTLGAGEYSSLVKNSITPFTAGLKIEFYKADLAQCKTGVTSQQITQLNVTENTTAQVCAVVTIYPSVSAKTNIWFAIESLQSGLADIILDAILPSPKKRVLELSNDQSAQIGVGGSYVFLHRLTNYGVENETKTKISINPVNGNDGFLYSLFLDKNGNDTLDASDTLLSGTETELSNIIEPNKSVTLLIKAEAPATATNGMNSQVKLTVKPDNIAKEILLGDLSNTDLITVSPNQLKILKSQLKVENCSMTNISAVINATYTVQNENLKPNQCLIYRIMVRNTGSAALSNVVINDMYPAYTKQWRVAEVLPIVGSNSQNITDNINNTIEDDGAAKIKAVLRELLPQQEKSLYFGIKMQ